MTFSGPSEPATKRPPASSAGLPREPRSLDVHVVDGALEPVVRLADRGRRERVRRRDVRAGGEVLPVDVEHEVGARQVEQVGIAGDVVRMVGEALAPVVLRVEPGVLDHRPPRAVEHEDPLREESSSLLRVSLTPSLSRPCLKRWEPEARGLFRRFLAWSPSCLQSFPGTDTLALG